jgi:hypothetical protein
MPAQLPSMSARCLSLLSVRTTRSLIQFEILTNNFLIIIKSPVTVFVMNIPLKFPRMP